VCRVCERETERWGGGGKGRENQRRYLIALFTNEMQVNEFNGNRWRGAILMRGYRRRGTSAAAAFSTIIHFECNIVRDMSTRSLL